MTCKPIFNQRGVALIMSLIILVVLTLLGLTSMQSTRTEIAMAGNMREADIAFQSAEMGLIASEEFIWHKQNNSLKLEFTNISDKFH